MATPVLCVLPSGCSLSRKLYRDAPPTAPHATPLSWQVRCSISQQMSPLPINRRSANYQPNIWSYDQLQYLKTDHDAVGMYGDRATRLEEEVKCMIYDEDRGPLATLELIDDIQRLGLGYRFEKDIKRALHRIICLEEFNAKTEKSLHATALSFRLLRQHGYEVSQDVFNSFKDQNGNFAAYHYEDVKGMLSLYEASYLAFEGEDLLDVAKAFTKVHLKDFKVNIGKSLALAEQVSHALELPFHHRMQRLEARWSIETYSKREGTNQVLLELAKLDFNMVQSVLQRDLRDMSWWWRSMGLTKVLNFARDRLMECFFWSVGMIFEPQYSNCRKGLTKVAALITTIDDIYDVYGTLDELELFTDAVQRWDVNAMRNLPDYMKLCFLALYNTVNEMAYDILKEQGEIILPYLTKVWQDLCKAFLQEARWCYNKYTPTFEEYLENAWVSVSGVVLLVHAYLLNQNITKQSLESLEKYHDLLRWPSIIFRLCNDLGTSKAELERGETASSILCYMHETGLSEELAREHMNNLIEIAWKKMNKCQFDEALFAKPFVETTINLARISQCTYQYGDGHGAPDERSKNRVQSLIIEPISLT